MSRLFSQATGKTVTAYVRGRRLTEAARALADGAPDILAVALQAGYGSHEAFTRALRDQFGLSPTDLRARTRRNNWPNGGSVAVTRRYLQDTRITSACPRIGRAAPPPIYLGGT
jgi:AraC family transcriptional regulator